MTDAEEKLARLMAEMARHQESAREFRLAGYVTMSERHERLLQLVAIEIRQHCQQFGLSVPEGLPPEEDEG